MTPSSRSQARLWPYPRHRRFEGALQAAASAWFKTKGFALHPKYGYHGMSLPRKAVL